ncbi:protein FAR1-RELATED SEQUENCE 5-like [Camellia sinensis]|uniref:protein FAR1-RELATED SEQUENCE 5-like n=1 Tax=Camellia sinensis TaxID=4442 RepID=UPI00103658CE|nr:protein FAR1-RELATED SEQUENCE 5-like [Camellia sinensis]
MTYLVNKYDIPFAPFVGVNHHGQSILLGCGLISSEDTESFTWLFQSWLTCMFESPMSAIITDQDRATKKAIAKVFPNARHRWCLWHIMKKVPEKLRKYKEYEPIKFEMENVVYDSLTKDEFEKRWDRFIEMFELQSNEWLLGLYEERHRWVPAFVKDIFWAGMSITQHSKSMHAFFDGYINSKTTLKQFVEQYENALAKRVENENDEEFNSFSSCILCISHYEIEKQFQSAYTRAKFKESQREILGKIYCDLTTCKEGGGISEYTIDGYVKVGESHQRATFIVVFKDGEYCASIKSQSTRAKFKESQREILGKIYCDLTTCKEGGGISEYTIDGYVKVGESHQRATFIVVFKDDTKEVNCNCRLFEFRGILCKHQIIVFMHRKIDQVPDKYILRRWDKNVKRSQMKVRIRAETDDKCDKIIERIQELKWEFTKVGDFCASNKPRSTSIHNGFPSCGDGGQGLCTNSIFFNGSESQSDLHPSWRVCYDLAPTSMPSPEKEKVEGGPKI